MRAETETRIEAWETRPAEDGYAGLHALVEAEFSGAITAGGTWLFLLDSRPIGLFDGSMESFADVPITAYVAPHLALPILFTMQERSGETTARYYTDDTPLADTAETLASSGFTGYVELSENVLSGEYYLVYHRGRSIQVAFVGEGEQLLTDDEARERANEEVGIYEVTAVTLEELDLPEPGPAPRPESGSAASDPSPSLAPTRGEGPPNGTPIADAESPVNPADSAVTATADSTDPAVADANAADAADGDADVSTDPDDSDDSPIDDADVERTTSEGSTDGALDPTDRWGSVVEEPVEDRLAAERRWREAVRTPLRSERVSVESPVPEPETRAEPDAATPASDHRRSTDELEAERRLRETAETEADRLREEVDSLRERLETLETADEVDGSRSGIEPPGNRTESIPPSRALSETDLFVRYATASGPTLEAVHTNGVDRTAVDGNLRLERHTRFDPADVLVDGRSFEAFLEGRIEHRFADWLVGSLPFDIRETGNERGLDLLYDAIPGIDRIDFDGVVDAGEDVDTEEKNELTFDVVFRSRMGEPLIVADCVESRAAVDEERVASLVTAANAARETEDELAAAMLVTTSFFDPGALETASEATRSGLLGRNARESYVTISRRRGYHLCLIEMRDAFHVRVPEL